MGAFILSEYFHNIVVGVKSFLTGMGLTFKHFKEKKDLVATLQYPNEKWPKPERDIGFAPDTYNVIRSRLHVDIDDCIGCLQCERACPVDCIKIDTIKPPKGSDYDCGLTSNDTQKKMIVPRFTIDMSECMYCDLCVHPCPEECIYMVGGPNEEKHEIDYEFSQYERHGLVFEFATATEQDIIDIGGENYLKDRKEKEDKRLKGENLEGIVESESSDTSDEGGAQEKKKHKDPLLEIFNIVPDKVARGIAKKAVVFGKRNNFDFVSMSSEVEKRITSAGRISAEMSAALENLKNYSEPIDKANDFSSLDSGKEEEATKDDTPASVSISEVAFTVKSLDFIEDKMIRGIAKKSFMAGKRSDLSDNEKIDLIIKDLDENEKNTDEIKNHLISLKSSKNIESNEIKNDVEAKNKKVELFSIKSLDIIEDKVARGSAKKIYMAAKRAGESSTTVIENILKELSDKLDEEVKVKLEDLK